MDGTKLIFAGRLKPGHVIVETCSDRRPRGCEREESHTHDLTVADVWESGEHIDIIVTRDDGMQFTTQRRKGGAVYVRKNNDNIVPPYVPGDRVWVIGDSHFKNRTGSVVSQDTDDPEWFEVMLDGGFCCAFRSVELRKI